MEQGQATVLKQREECKLLQEGGSGCELEQYSMGNKLGIKE